MERNQAAKGLVVRCIDGNFHTRRTDPVRVEELSMPKEGQDYTIREVVVAGDGQDGLLFLEVQNPAIMHDIGDLREPCFSLWRFEVVQ